MNRQGQSETLTVNICGGEDSPSESVSVSRKSISPLPCATIGAKCTMGAWCGAEGLGVGISPLGAPSHRKVISPPSWDPMVEHHWCSMGAWCLGFVSKAHRLVYHSTLGLRVIKKKKISLGFGGWDFGLSVLSLGVVDKGLGLSACGLE